VNFYTIEKELEFERERLSRISWEKPPRRPRKTLFGPLAAGAGRTLRRVGESLEQWGSPAAPEHEHTHAHGHVPHI
jgi:hypothetical protein